MSKKKKPYRAVVQLGKHSSLKACDTIEEARGFLATKGGGVIEKRAYKMLHADGHGLERVEYDPPLRLDDWQFVERIGARLVARPDATFGYWIESDYPLRSDWLPKEAFTTIYQDRSKAIATAVEGVIDQTTEVRVVDLLTGEVIWNSMEEEFE
jgi:hypothetical protein